MREAETANGEERVPLEACCAQAGPQPVWSCSSGGLTAQSRELSPQWQFLSTRLGQTAWPAACVPGAY